MPSQVYHASNFRYLVLNVHKPKINIRICLMREKNLTSSIQPRTRIIKVNSRKHLSIRTSQSQKFFGRVSMGGGGGAGDKCERETMLRKEKYRRSSRVHCREPSIFETSVRVTRLVDGSASRVR